VGLLCVSYGTMRSWVASSVTGSSRTLHGVAAVDALGLTAVAVGAAGTILRTDDGGGSWSTVGSGVSGDLLSIAFISQVRRPLSSPIPLKKPVLGSCPHNSYGVTAPCRRHEIDPAPCVRVRALDESSW